MEDWLAASLSLSDGRVIRFGGDEAEAENIPEDLSFETQIPGGFGSASITLPRPSTLYADDARLFSEVKIYGPLGTAFEGYVTGVPQVGAEEIRLELSGFSTVLDRYQTFKEIFVDRDLGAWENASLAREVAAGGSRGGPEVIWDTTTPALKLTAESGTPNPINEAWYDAGPGLTIASIYYDMVSVSTSDYVGDIGVATTDSSGLSSSADLLTGTNSSASGTLTPATPRRYGVIRFFLIGTVSGGEKYTHWRNLAVYGNHGLTLQGTNPKGVSSTDVIRYVIGKTNLTTTSESIDRSPFIIPHLVFKDDTAITQVIEQVTALGGSQNTPNEWGVYEDKVFFWKPQGTYGRTWHVRRDQVATTTSEGPDADNRVAGMKILYEDTSGRRKSIGPPGSNSDVETSDLLSSDPDNPARRIPGAFATETVGITSQAGALNIGKLILNERNSLKWRGSVQIEGEAMDPQGNPYPVHLVRAGDSIVIEDDADPRPRPINSTSYNHEDLAVNASVGARPDTLEALLGNLAMATELYG